jgi:hypothetical protein
MIKRMMFWAAMASMTGAVAAETLSLDRPFPARESRLAIGLKSASPARAKAVLADINESEQLLASNPADMDHFGYSVAIDGNTAVVGAFEKDGANPDVGAVYVFQRSGNEWPLQAQLTTPTTVQDARFGRAVAISGDTIAVGAPFDDHAQATSGAVYIFTRSGTVWTQRAKLGADATSGDRFGWSVALEGSTLAVGAPTDETTGAANAGALFVFTGSGATWTQQGAALAASTPEESDLLGSSIAISGDVLVAGAEGEDQTNVDSGAAYVFTRSAGVWTERARLRAAAPGENNLFGHSVAVDGGTLVVGEPGRVSNTGGAHVFVGSGASWSLQQFLTPADAAEGDAFGHAVALRGDLALVGAYNEEDSSGPFNRGAVYVWRRSGSTWTQPDKFLASDATSGDRFGFGLALTPGAAVVGAPYDANGSNVEAGSAYVFHLGTPTTTIQIVDPTSAKFGQTISLSAQVSGGTPTGNVEFRNGASVLATAALNGSFVAAANITPAVGAYSITANYVGDANHIGSSSAATAVTVSKADTSLALNTTGSPTDYGQTVTFTAPISVTAPGAGSPSGNIEFRDNGTLIATQPLIAGEATLSINSLPVNSGNPHPITATYTGSGNYNGSTIGPINHVVNRVQPTMQLNSSLDPSLLGQQLTISAVITGGIPTCFVDFEADNLGDGNPAFNIGGAAVSGGTAAITWTPPAVGDYAITATCGGDANQFATNGSGLTQNVLPSADVSVTKSNGADSVQSGQDTTYTIVVTNPAGGADTDGLLVNDTLNPAQFDVPNADWSCAPAGICSPESGTGNIADLPLDLAAGSSVTITLTVPVLPEAESGVSNTVSLTLPNGVGDPNPANNTATDSDRSGLFGDGFEDSGLPN